MDLKKLFKRHSEKEVQKNMDPAEAQRLIEQTCYWDAKIFDFQISYFGDEVTLYLEDDETTCWQIKFLGCYSLSYQTDADYRGTIYVRDMSRPQLGYFGQDISVRESELEGFLSVSLNLFLLEGKLECKEVEVQKLETDTIPFFWRENGR